MSAGRTDSGDPGHETEGSDGASGRGTKPRRGFLRRVVLRLAVFVPLVLALLVLALTVYVSSAAFESRVRDRLVLTLEERLQTEVGLGRVEVKLLPASIEFFELNVEGTDGELALEVPRGEIGMSLRGLLSRRLELDRIELDRPVVSLRFDESGQHNLPIPVASGGDGSLSVSVGQTVIRDGEVAFQDVRWPVSAVASEVGFEAAGFGRDGAQFDMRLREVQVRGSEDGAEVDLGLRLEIAEGSVALPRIELSGDQIAATLAGSWPGDGDEPTFSLQLDGDVEADLLRRLGWLPLDLVGRFDLQGELSVAPSTGVVYQTSLDTRRARLFGRELRNISGTLEGQRDLLKVVFGADWHEGPVQATVELSPEIQDSRRLDVKVVGRDLTLASLLEEELAETSLDMAWGELSATASLEFDYAFDVRAAQAGIGRGVIRVTPEDGAIPVSGSVPFLMENGVLRSEAVAVRTPSMSIDGALAFALGDSAGSGVFSVTSPAVGASSDEVFKLLRQDRPAWWFTQGRASLEGRLEVVDGEPTVRLSGSVDRLASAQLEVDRVEGVARYQQGAFRDVDAKLFRAGGTLEVGGTVPLLSDQGETIRGLQLIRDLTGELEDWPLESFGADLGFRGRATGRLGYLPSSRLALGAQQEGLFFEGRLADIAQELMGETFRFGGDLDVRGSLRGDVVDLETLRSVRAGRLRGEGQWHVSTGEVQAQLRLAKSEVLLETSGERFQLDGSVALSGLLGSPQLQAELRASTEDSRTAQLSLGWDGESGSATGSLPGVGAFEASGTRDATGTSATATFSDIDVREVLANFAEESRAGALLGEVDGDAALKVRLEAAHGQPAWVQVESPRLDLVVGEQRLRLIEPARVLIEDGRIKFESLFLESPEGNAEVFLVGEAEPMDESGSRQLDLRLQAAGPAEWLEKLGLQGDLTGRLELLSSVAGTTADPLFNGVAALRGGRFKPEDFPYAVEEIEVVTLIYPDRAVVDRGVGRVAGGTVRAEGEVAFPELDVRLRGAFDDIRMRYPDDWSVAGDGEVTLNREAGKPFQLRGQVRVDEMVYDRDIARGFGQLLRTMFEPSTERIAIRDEDPLLVMDLDVVGRRALKIRNNIAEMEGDLALRVRGDPSAPRLFGEIGLRQGGRLDYGGEQYVIERGRLVFDSPYSNEPQLDLSATTRRLDYTVTLALSGTRDRLTATLSSDPPLPELDVWSLLASGDVASSPGLGGPQLDRSSVGAEALLYGQASSLVEDRVSSLFGLDRFRLNPISSGDSLASARVTVGKRFSRDLFLTYSVDPSSTGDGVVEVEWRLSDRVVLVLSQNADGTYSVAARLEQVF